MQEELYRQTYNRMPRFLLASYKWPQSKGLAFLVKAFTFVKIKKMHYYDSA